MEVFIWCLSATISPLLLIAGYWVKPYRWALASPLSAYAVQLMYIWRDEKWIQRDYFWQHTIAFILTFYVVIQLYNVLRYRKSREFYIEIIKSLFMFIGPEVEEKGYIKPEMKEEFARRRIQLTDKAVGNE